MTEASDDEDAESEVTEESADSSDVALLEAVSVPVSEGEQAESVMIAIESVALRVRDDQDFIS